LSLTLLFHNQHDLDKLLKASSVILSKSTVSADLVLKDPPFSVVFFLSTVAGIFKDSFSALNILSSETLAS
jgi:hypothetical protein